MHHLFTQVDMVLTFDPSLLHILERWLEGSQALDRLHRHILTVLHTYHHTDFICPQTYLHTFVELHGSKRRIKWTFNIQVFFDRSVHEDTPGSIRAPDVPPRPDRRRSFVWSAFDENWCVL